MCIYMCNEKFQNLSNKSLNMNLCDKKSKQTKESIYLLKTKKKKKKNFV